MPRTIVIGDIHGCATALESILRAIDLQADDTLVTLGDYIDRGLDSKGVLDQLIALADRCNLVPLVGNHDEMLLRARNSRSDFRFWLECGGIVTLDSYGATGKLNLIPAAHFRFLEGCRSFHETETHFFCHANYEPNLPLDQQDDKTLRWLSLRDSLPGPQLAGKVAVLGHTPQQPDILDLGYLKCIDGGCGIGGWLTAFDVTTGVVWQVDEKGRRRPGRS